MLLEMSNITRTYPGVIANDEIDFDLKQGEIHALLGENGAGKSTLVKILSGFIQPDSGNIKIRNNLKVFRSPAEAISSGVGMIHQHFKLVESFTAAENIILGHPDSPLTISSNKIEEKVQEIADQYEFNIDPSAKIWQLSVGDKQWVEIIRTLYRGAKIVILDEPTSVLTPQESDQLFNSLERIKDQNHGIVFITHKLDEVMQIADRVTVLRDGMKIKTLNVTDTTQEELADLMVGENLHLDKETEERSQGKKIMEINDFVVRDDRGLRAIDELNLEVHESQIVGLAGVTGSGQQELSEALSGLRPVESGSITVNGKDITNKNPRTIRENGLSTIPPDRQHTGLVPNLSLVENSILHDYPKSPNSKWGFLNRNANEAFALRLAENFDVKFSDPYSKVSSLSGGNQQKLLISREISSDPDILVATYPTRGLDVGTKKKIHRKLLNCRNEGMGILLMSESLDELIQISDVIQVLFSGQIVDTFPPDTNKRDKIGLAMGGEKAK